MSGKQSGYISPKAKYIYLFIFLMTDYRGNVIKGSVVFLIKTYD